MPNVIWEVNLLFEIMYKILSVSASLKEDACSVILEFCHKKSADEPADSMQDRFWNSIRHLLL